MNKLGLSWAKLSQPNHVLPHSIQVPLPPYIPLNHQLFHYTLQLYTTFRKNTHVDFISIKRLLLCLSQELTEEQRCGYSNLDGITGKHLIC